jgi:hypothetical protein
VSHFTPETARPDWVLYAEEMVGQAMRDGYVPPALLLECVHYAAEPELMAVIRAVAELDPGQRLVVMAYARRLSRETCPDCADSEPQT